MLTHVPEGAKKLPDGFLDGLVQVTGKQRSELKARRQFAECYPSPEALADVSANHKSWFAIVHDALPAEARAVETGEAPAKQWGKRESTHAAKVVPRDQAEHSGRPGARCPAVAHLPVSPAFKRGTARPTNT